MLGGKRLRLFINKIIGEKFLGRLSGYVIGKYWTLVCSQAKIFFLIARAKKNWLSSSQLIQHQ